MGFQPTIEITAAHNATKAGSIIAHAFQFVKNPSRGALSNIIQYNTTADLQWGPLSTELTSNSIVNDIKEYQDSLYIVGSFKGTDSSNGVYNNIVQYNSGKLKALKSGGTNGPIESIAITPQTGEIFVAGNFSALASSNTTQISSVGRYNVAQATWNPLEGVRRHTCIHLHTKLIDIYGLGYSRRCSQSQLDKRPYTRVGRNRKDFEYECLWCWMVEHWKSNLGPRHAILVWNGLLHTRV